jgi:hypothetical protein
MVLDFTANYQANFSLRRVRPTKSHVMATAGFRLRFGGHVKYP